jgi:hypothetical protein
MRKSELQETLVSLYLRLNGYFVSGFIVHSPGDDGAGNRTQVDALAIRLPHNAEPERQVLPAEYLQIPAGVTDIALCEVKGGHEALQFNPALREAETIRSVLRWVGAFEAPEIERLLPPLHEMLTPRDPDTPQAFRAVRSEDKRYQVRTILFAPDRPEPRNNQTRYVCGDEIVAFINACLRAHPPRPACATRYDFGLWGGMYEPIIRLIKSSDRNLALEDIYAELVDAGT